MITWAIVPVKPLIRAKSRLADVLTPKERENLSLKMLIRTIKTLKEVSALNNILVISRDTQVLSMMRNMDVHTVQESGNPELNDALTRATKLLMSWHVEATIILPADLPLLCKEDVEEMLSLGRYRNSIVIAPDANEDGTNALLVHPPSIIDYSYGQGSYKRHAEAAKNAGSILHVFETERIQLDVDTPNDLAYYQMMAAKLGENAIDFTTGVEENAEGEYSVADPLMPDRGSNG